MVSPVPVAPDQYVLAFGDPAAPAELPDLPLVDLAVDRATMQAAERRDIVCRYVRPDDYGSENVTCSMS